MPLFCIITPIAHTEIWIGFDTRKKKSKSTCFSLIQSRIADFDEILYSERIFWLWLIVCKWEHSWIEKLQLPFDVSENCIRAHFSRCNVLCYRVFRKITRKWKKASDSQKWNILSFWLNSCQFRHRTFSQLTHISKQTIEEFSFACFVCIFYCFYDFFELHFLLFGHRMRNVRDGAKANK